jgi:hypothetical protein
MNDKRTKIKELFLKNFNEGEIKSILKVTDEEIKSVIDDMSSLSVQENSIEFYKELQKELSKLVLTEMNKSNRDSSVILNAIKLQADIQEKKISLNKGGVNVNKVSKDYIYERDEEIKKMFDSGTALNEISKQCGINILSVKNALDRVNLNLSEELKSLTPSIISETKGFDRDMRLNILQEAYDSKMTRDEVRELVNKLKNKTR